MEEHENVSLDHCRRFGVELEYNSTNGEDHQPLRDSMPEGTRYIANLVRKITNDSVLVHKWNHDHHNECWIAKPDGSCGFEICTPVLKGGRGIRKISKVIDKIAQDSLIKSDDRCSVHVHVEMSDLDIEQIASVVAWWIKCEAVFLDSVPPRRKKNRYCQHLGITDLFEHDVDYAAYNLIKKIGGCKYYTVNTFHMSEGKRCTMEFRILEEEGCLDSEMTANWIKLVLHFVDCAAKRGLPSKYRSGSPWSGLLWLDPIDVMKFLKFDQSLSEELSGVRNWFIDRLVEHTMSSEVNNITGREARKFAYSQTVSLAKEFDREVPAGYILSAKKGENDIQRNAIRIDYRADASIGRTSCSVQLPQDSTGVS
jgi:hypothetical protein